MATTLTRHTRSLSLCLPLSVAQTVSPVSVCSAPLPVTSTPHAFPSFAITSSRLPVVCRWRRCAHETLHDYCP